MDFTDLRIIKTQERLENALLELLETKKLKAVTVKEICDKAGISRNAFYQHYRFKEDLYNQMVEEATEKIRSSLNPLISDVSQIDSDIVTSYAEHIVDGMAQVKDLISVMVKDDNGVFLRQFSDLIYEQIFRNALPFYDVKDSEELRLYYEFVSVGMSAFIIGWVRDGEPDESRVKALLADILLEVTVRLPQHVSE